MLSGHRDTTRSVLRRAFEGGRRGSNTFSAKQLRQCYRAAHEVGHVCDVSGVWCSHSHNE